MIFDLTQNKSNLLMVVSIFASNTIANVIARHSRLITLAVLFQAARAFTVAPAQVFSFVVYLFPAFGDFGLEE